MSNITKRYRRGLCTAIVGLMGLMGCTATNSVESPAKDDVTILKFANEGVILAKTSTLSKMISADVGGSLSFLFPHGSTSEDAVLSVTLTVPPQSLSQDSEISLSFDGQSLDFEFEPDGTYFSTPARLDVDAKGVDLAGVNSENVSLFYSNQAEQNWEPMPTDSVTIIENTGHLRLVNATIPHFSRYVLAEE